MIVDDTNLFLSDENMSELFQQMNKELKSVFTWFKANKLSINIDKTKWTIFYPTSKTCFMPTKFPELFIDGITLEPLMKMSDGKPILTQCPQRFLKALVHFIE